MDSGSGKRAWTKSDELCDRELGILAAVLSRLIPSDENGPGATEANVVEYIVRALATHHRQHVSAYREGLLNLDALGTARYGRGFAEVSEARQDEILAGVEAQSAAADEPAGSFFPLVLQHAREGMFGDPSWGGNADFVGWKLVGYPGPRYGWTREDQALDRPAPPEFRSVIDLPPPVPPLDS